MGLSPIIVGCSSWEDIEAEINKLVGDDPYNWLFRGQQDSTWSLQSKLERVSNVSNRVETGDRLIGEFRSKAHLYADRLPDTSDSFGWLSMMQHHGIATQLLDWTYSAYVALFFSVELENSDVAGSHERGALWAVHKKTVEEAYRGAEAARRIEPVQPHASPAEVVSTLNRFFQTGWRPDYGLVAPVLPSFHVSRLSSQQGCFLMNCNPRISFEDSLADMMKEWTTPWLLKLTFPKSLRKTFLKRLMHLNIHPATLYPDLEGLAKFINMKNELFPVVGKA